MYNIFCRYLHEIGYTDTIIDVRSSRVRNLLGINNNNNLSIDQGQGENQLNGNNYNKRFSDNQGQCSPTKRVSNPLKQEYFKYCEMLVKSAVEITGMHASCCISCSAMCFYTGLFFQTQQQQQQQNQKKLLDVESAVMANFEFLQTMRSTSDSGDVDMEDDGNDDDDDDEDDDEMGMADDVIDMTSICKVC